MNNTCNIILVQIFIVQSDRSQISRKYDNVLEYIQYIASCFSRHAHGIAIDKVAIIIIDSRN